MLRFEDIRFDCSLYNGYKPCKYGNECLDCPHYSPLMPPDAQSGFPNRPGVLPLRGDGFNVLLIKTGAMGDVLRTTSLLAPLKRAHPDARITWITEAAALPLLRNNPFIDELLPFNPEQVKSLQGNRWNLVMNYEKDRAQLSLAGDLESDAKVGFAPTLWGTSTVFNAEAQYGLLLGLSDELKFRVNTKSYPQIIAEMAGLPWLRDPYILRLGADAQRRCAEIEELCANAAALDSVGVSSAKGSASERPARIGLNTGCGSVFRTKQWPIDGWMELIDFLKEKAPRAQLLLLGGPAEEEMNQRLAARYPGLLGTGSDNSLEEFIGVVQACDLVVSSDSLAMHIAVALEKWVGAIFGSTSAVEVDLFDRGEKIITDFACSPCYLKACDKSPTCMEAMRGLVVGEAVMRGLAAYVR